ncbi:MAG TPA: alkaline phosphatase family protein [Candidatus Tumulicola sp.]|jgi:phospholipase C
MKAGAAMALVTLVAVAACGAPAPVPAGSRPASRSTQRANAASLPTPIRHVVVIVQENRTPDDLFQSMASHGADIARQAVTYEGQVVQLREVSLAAPYDLGHNHSSFLNDCNLQADGNCAMDGFDRGRAPRYRLQPFGYAPANEVRPYAVMAHRYTFADRMFQSNQSGSFPSHQYLVSGSASALPTTQDNVSGDPFDSKTGAQEAGGCDARPSAVVDTIDPADGSPGPTPFPCFERPVLSDFLDRGGISWRYYQHHLGPGLWHAFDAIEHVRYGPDYANVVSPPETILTDIKRGRLPAMSWVMPADGPHSDHSGNRSAAGPSWVAAVVNALGTSRYWDSTVILLTWDDWGGWYDHVPPPQMNDFYELSFRVPLVVISPYAKPAYVSHVQYEFGSLLAFAEETFGIPKGALGTTDVRANDLSDCFDFTQSPRAFVRIPAPRFVPGKGGSNAFDEEDP